MAENSRTTCLGESESSVIIYLIGLITSISAPVLQIRG